MFMNKNIITMKKINDNLISINGKLIVNFVENV